MSESSSLNCYGLTSDLIKLYEDSAVALYAAESDSNVQLQYLEDHLVWDGNQVWKDMSPNDRISPECFYRVKLGSD